VDALKRAEAAPGIEIRRAAGPNFRHFDFNGTSEVLKDVRVRKAIGKAINRATLAKALIGPLGFDTAPLNNHIFMTNQRGYKNNAGDVASPDIAGAKKLLDEAGWTASGAGTRTKDGKPLSVRFVIPSEVTTSAQEGELAQGMLKEIGVDLKIEVVPSDDFFEKYITPGNFDMTTFSWIGTQFPISSSISIYESPKGDEIQQNYARVGSAELDAKLNAAAAELDPDKAIDLANEADAMIWDLVHSLTLYQRPEIIAAKPKLANFGASGFASNAYENIGFTT
jgi:peptide/nickel transport system substrate-binding protein